MDTNSQTEEMWTDVECLHTFMKAIVEIKEGTKGPKRIGTSAFQPEIAAQRLWFLGLISSRWAEMVLKRINKDGAFLVRVSLKYKGLCLSVLQKELCPTVFHFPIKIRNEKEYYIERDTIYEKTLSSLIIHYAKEKGALPTVLRCHPVMFDNVPNVNTESCKLNIEDFTIEDKNIGSGSFGIVRKGKWKNKDVAIKSLKQQNSEKEFLKEAQVMMQLHHPNIVIMYGVCTMNRQITIVTEFMENGSLYNFIFENQQGIKDCTVKLQEICLQVCKGMEYLERHKCVHRDLAARNVLVGKEWEVKVADFGLTRFLSGDEYMSSNNTVCPFRWSPPEVLTSRRFSHKSDVWSYGVLLWEIFSGCDLPYENKKSKCDVVIYVKNRNTLEKPKQCTEKYYGVMKKCWAYNACDRPRFNSIQEMLIKDSESELTD